MNINSPEHLRHQYDLGMYAEGEFFDGLLSCARLLPPNLVVNVLTAEELRRFKLLVFRYRHVRSNNEFIRINNPPAWGVEEIKGFLRFFGRGKSRDAH